MLLPLGDYCPISTLLHHDGAALGMQAVYHWTHDSKSLGKKLTTDSGHHPNVAKNSPMHWS